jgi:hypothetical protein
MNYELWHSKNENSYLSQGVEHYKKSLAQNKNFSPDLELIWAYKAKTHFEAMQAYYDYLDCGQYKPEPDWEDIVYDEFD